MASYSSPPPPRHGPEDVERFQKSLLYVGIPLGSVLLFIAGLEVNGWIQKRKQGESPR